MAARKRAKGRAKAGRRKTAARRSTSPKKRSTLTRKQLAQRKYAASLRGLRTRAKKAAGGKGRVAKRSSATRLRRKLGLQAGR